MKKLVLIKLPKKIHSQLNTQKLVSECQSIMSAKKLSTEPRISFTCENQHIPTALTEIIKHLFDHHELQTIDVTDFDITSHISQATMIGKVQVDKVALTEFSKRAYKLNQTLGYTDVWVSNDKDNSLIFRCKTSSYSQALVEITKVLMSKCGAQFVRPMKLRKYRLPLESRQDLQDTYARTKHRVSHIASMFKISPTAADTFCIQDASRHPELFLTDEQVESFNSIFRRQKKRSLQ